MRRPNERCRLHRVFATGPAVAYLFLVRPYASAGDCSPRRTHRVRNRSLPLESRSCLERRRAIALIFPGRSAFPKRLTSNHSMKPTAPLRCRVSVFATDPGRGLSLSREMTSRKSASCFWDLKNRRWRRRHRAEFGTPDPIATSQRLFGGSRASRPSRACRRTLRPFALR